MEKTVGMITPHEPHWHSSVDHPSVQNKDIPF